jgi:DNA-binding winged helix-turn-helix (wHTH) protein
VSAPSAGEVAGEERTDAGFAADRLAADRLAADRLVDGFTADGLAGRLAGGALTGPTAGAGRGAVRAAPGRAGEPAQLDPVVIDRDSRYASVADRALDLTYREFELLAVLAEHPGRVFTREHLLRTAWNHAAVGSRTVDVHVRRLRVKLGPEARRLTTIRNVGYRFEPAPAGRIAATLETVA